MATLPLSIYDKYQPWQHYRFQSLSNINTGKLSLSICAKYQPGQHCRFQSMTSIKHGNTVAFNLCQISTLATLVLSIYAKYQPWQHCRLQSMPNINHYNIVAFNLCQISLNKIIFQWSEESRPRWLTTLILHVLVLILVILTGMRMRSHLLNQNILADLDGTTEILYIETGLYIRVGRYWN
jgi:hypothetical protein